MNKTAATILSAAAITCISATSHAQDYKIGYISDFSGPFVDTFAPVYDGFKAYMDGVNAAGGINGHKVDIVVRDDQLNATRAASLFREVVESEGVNSVWSLSLSSTLPGVYALGERLEVPSISSVSAIDATLPPAQAFAYSTGNPFKIAGIVAGELAPDVVPDKGGMVCVTIDSAGGVSACENTEKAGNAAGFSVSSIYFPPRTVEYGALGQKIAESDPSVVVTHLPAGLAPGVLIAARSAGYDGPMMLHNVALNELTVIDAMKQVGTTDNTYIFSRYVLAQDELADVDAMRKAVTAAGIDADKISSNHVIGWVHARVAEAALKACGSPCSGKQLNDALTRISVDMGELTGGPVTYTADDHQGDSWWKLYKFDAAAGRFIPQGEWVRISSRAGE